MFEFAHSFSGLKWHQLETVKLLSDICATILMVRKRNIDEMKKIDNKKSISSRSGRHPVSKSLQALTQN